MPSKPRSASAPLLLAVLWAFSGASPAVHAAEGDTIRIGAVLPVTGKESKIGSAYKQATELAIREINDGGGIDVGGRKLKVDLPLLDDTSDPAKGAQLVEQLITQEKVHAVVGGYGSQLVQGQSVMPERYGVPFLAGGAGARSIYGRSKWVFGTLSPVDVMASTQMDLLDALVGAGKLRKPVKIALVTENTEHGKDYAQGVEDFVKTHPGEFVVALEESFELYTPDFKPLLSRVAGAKAEVLTADPHLADHTPMHRPYTRSGLYH